MEHFIRYDTQDNAGVAEWILCMGKISKIETEQSQRSEVLAEQIKEAYTHLKIE